MIAAAVTLCALPQAAASRVDSAPANDSFAAAQVLSGASGSASGSNVGATKEPGEPALAGNSGGASIWFSWTAPAAGSTTVDTSGSGFDTLLGVYTGSSVSALGLVASNDDVSGSNHTSAVSFTAAAGTTYMIAVDGYNGPSSGQATGPVTLNWSGATSAPPPSPPPSTAPANDLFGNAQALSGGSGSVAGS
ncbi:MAG: PPC domain-containing protein, partial [Gaiellaceae bacterium]